MVLFDMLGMVSYYNSNFVRKTHVFEIFDFKNAVTLTTGLGIRQVYWKCHHSKKRIGL